MFLLSCSEPTGLKPVQSNPQDPTENTEDSIELLDTTPYEITVFFGQDTIALDFNQVSAITLGLYLDSIVLQRDFYCSESKLMSVYDAPNYLILECCLKQDYNRFEDNFAIHFFTISTDTNRLNLLGGANILPPQSLAPISFRSKATFYFQKLKPTRFSTVSYGSILDTNSVDWHHSVLRYFPD